MLIAVAALIVIVVVAMAALALWNGQDRAGDQGVGLVLEELVDPAEGTLPAEPGHRYVQVTMTMNNRAAGDVALSPSDFQLLGDDGRYYEYSEKATVEMPDMVTAGGSATLTLGFEVPDGVEPAKIVFNGQYA